MPRAMRTGKVYLPLIGLDDLRLKLIDKCRKIARVNTQNHPWADMDDMQLIQSAQLYQTDPQTKQSGVTLADVLLLGTDQLILSVVPAHRTDLILRKVNVDRYDDRDLVRTNLIDSYDRIFAFVQKHLPDPFYLDGIERISLRDFKRQLEFPLATIKNTHGFHMSFSLYSSFCLVFFPRLFLLFVFFFGL